MTVANTGALTGDVAVPDELANNVFIGNIAKLLDPLYNLSLIHISEPTRPY